MNIVLKRKIETEDLKFTSPDWYFQIIHVEDISKKKVDGGLKTRKLKDNNKKVLCCRYMKIVKNPKCTDIENLAVDISTVKGGCWIDLLLNVYTKSFNKRCKRFKISADTLIDFLGRKPNDDYSYSIEEVLPFFVKFKLTLKVHNPKGQLIFSYMPEKYNHDHPKSMIIVSNNHVYRMNYLIASIEQRVNHKKLELKAPSNTYKVKIIEEEEDSATKKKNEDSATKKKKKKKKKVKKEVIKQYYMANCEDELIQLIITAVGDIEILTTFHLDETIKTLYDAGIMPEILSTKFGNVIKFRLGFDEYSVVINNTLYSNLPCDIDDIKNITKDDWMQYEKFKGELFASTIQAKKRSYYSDNLDECISVNKRYALIKSFQETQTENKIYEIDCVKSYASILQDIPSFGVFTVFDNFKSYQDEEIKIEAFYIVKRPHILSVAEKVLFDRKYIMMSGYSIISLGLLKLNIIQVIYPYKSVTNDAGVLIKKIFKSSMSMVLKKYTCNSFIGSMGKLNNRNTEYCLTDSEEEIEEFSVLTGEYHQLDNDLYISQNSKSTKLINGFYPLQHMIYCYQRVKLYNIIIMAQKHNFDILGCKTDAIFIQETESSDFTIKDKCTGKFGEVKFTEKMFKVNPENQFVSSNNSMIQIPDNKQNKIDIKDEYNTYEINSKILNMTSLTALYPGCGKSYLLKKIPGSTLFVCPYNRLCYDNRINGIASITLDKFLGLGFKFKDGEFFNVPEKYCEQYDNIVIDEINCHSVYKLQKLTLFIKSMEPKEEEFVDPDISIEPRKTNNFYCAGDENQLESIGDDSEKSIYINKCIKKLFKNNICLEFIKRQDCEEDITKIKKIRELLLYTENVSIKEVTDILGYISIDQVLEQDRHKQKNICYYNDTVDRLNNLISGGFIVGDDIICRKTHNFKDIRIMTNCLYRIDEQNKCEFTLYDYENEKQFVLTHQQMAGKFKACNGFTGHSIQGLTFGDDDFINIFNTDSKWVSKKWLWVAITRVSSLKNLRVCVDNTFQIEGIQSVYSKIQSYKTTDVSKGLEAKNVLSRNDINKKLINQSFCCYHCKNSVKLQYEEGDLMQWSVDRLKNTSNGKDLGHTDDNTVISCLLCNVSKK